MAARKRTVRTVARPPPMKLLPRHRPDCRVKGARPASAAILRRSRRPSSGSSARRVRATTGPTPGTETRRSFFLAPQRRSAHLIADLLVELGKLGLEGLLHAGDASCHPLVVDATPALAFGRHHLDDLAAS